MKRLKGIERGSDVVRLWCGFVELIVFIYLGDFPGDVGLEVGQEIIGTCLGDVFIFRFEFLACLGVEDGVDRLSKVFVAGDFRLIL